MRRVLPYVIALVLGVAAAVAVGCGDRSKLIPPSQASNLKAQLAQIKSDVDAGRCAGLGDKLSRLHADAAALAPPVDRDLRRRINEGVRSLEQTAPSDCQTAAAGQTDTTTTDTVPTDTTPTETVPTDTTPTATTPPATTTEPPATTTEPTVPTDTTATPPAATDPNAPPAANGGTSGDGQVP